jgi:hypothetical protein
MRLALGSSGVSRQLLLAGILFALLLPACTKVNVTLKTGQCTTGGEDGGAAGCYKRAAKPGDYANDGTACTSGYVCRTIGASCDPSNPGASCKTIHLGGGNCDCKCQ